MRAQEKQRQRKKRHDCQFGNRESHEQKHKNEGKKHQKQVKQKSVWQVMKWRSSRALVGIFLFVYLFSGWTMRWQSLNFLIDFSVFGGWFSRLLLCISCPVVKCSVQFLSIPTTSHNIYNNNNKKCAAELWTVSNEHPTSFVPLYISIPLIRPNWLKYPCHRI